MRAFLVSMGLSWSLFGDTPVSSDDSMRSALSLIPTTVGDPEQVGRVWVAKNGTGPSSAGHLSVLVAVDGRCVFENGNNDVPAIFYGAQFHMGLKRDSNDRITRSTELRCESWQPGSLDGPEPEPRPYFVGMS